MKHITRILTGALSIYMASSMTLNAVAAGGDYFPDVPHDEIPYSEMSHDLLDTAPFYADAEAFSQELASEKPDVDKLVSLFNSMEKIFIEMSTVTSVLLNDMNLNATDTATGEKYTIYYNEMLRLDLIKNQLGKDILATDLADEFNEKIGPDLTKALEEAVVPTDEQLRLEDEINLLQVDYNSKANMEYTKELDGIQYNLDELYSLMFEEKITLDELYTYAAELQKQYNDNLADTYFAMIEKRQALAKSYGYENFYDYAAEEYFFRDTTQEQYNTFSNAVAEFVPALQNDLGILLTNEPSVLLSNPLYNSTNYELDQLTKPVGDYIAKLSPEMSECYQYIERLGLWDLISDEKRVPTTYCSMLSPYKPYIFNGYGNAYGELAGNLFHEFGHANQMYYTQGQYDILNCDLSEVHSTGLEMLSIPFYEKQFGAEGAREYTTNLTLYQLQSMIEGCMINELEHHIYVDGVKNMDEISAYYADIARKYGQIPADDTRTALYGWAQISHIFIAPCYYISYATSAATALELYLMSTEDFDQALDTYLRIVAQGSTNSLVNTLTNADMPNVLERDAIENLIEKLYTVLDVDARVAAVYAMNGLEDPDDTTTTTPTTTTPTTATTTDTITTTDTTGNTTTTTGNTTSTISTQKSSPHTGSQSPETLLIVFISSMLLCLGLWIVKRKKEEEQ